MPTPRPLIKPSPLFQPNHFNSLFFNAGFSNQTVNKVLHDATKAIPTVERLTRDAGDLARRRLLQPVVSTVTRNPLLGQAARFLGGAKNLVTSTNPLNLAITETVGHLMFPPAAGVENERQLINKSNEYFRKKEQAQYRPETLPGNLSVPPTGSRSSYTPPAAGLTPAGRTGIVRGLDAKGQPDRTQGDEYRNLLAQYGGQNALEAFVGSKTAPTSVMVGGKPMATSLADYYGAQQVVGAKNIDSLISDLGYTGNMEAWAKANPSLALREYNKKFGNQTPTQGPAGFMPSPTGPIPAAPQATPAVGGMDTSKLFTGNAPAPWYSQGMQVSQPYDAVKPLQAMKTNMANNMTNLDLTGQADEFIRQMTSQATQPYFR